MKKPCTRPVKTAPPLAGRPSSTATASTDRMSASEASIISVVRMFGRSCRCCSTGSVTELLTPPSTAPTISAGRIGSASVSCATAAINATLKA